MQIIKNAPIPEKNTVGRPGKYPFDDMEIGDSLLDEGAESVSKSKLYAAAKRYAKKNDVEFVGRLVDGGVQVWLTAD